MKQKICILLASACLMVFFCACALADAAQNQATIYTYLTEHMGLTRAAACGILSNIKSESGFRPEAIGDSGNAYGICQWNSRRQSLINFCENNGYESWQSLEGQLGYLEYELQNNKKSVGTYLAAIPDTAQGAYDAAWYFCVYYEIPASRYDKGVTRGKTAVNTYFKQYGGSISTYTISYNANGGSGAPASGTKTEGVPFTVSGAAPTRKGYQLMGWSEDRSGKATIYRAGEYFSENRNATLYAIWERSADADTPADAKVALNGHTYEYYSGAFSWARAQEFAAVKGGYLASPRSREEMSAIQTLVASSAGNCWLGGKYVSGNWTWLSGEAFDDAFASSYWASGNPISSVGANANGCLAVNSDGKLLDMSADSLNCAGLIVEYGETDRQNFPLYLITVSSSLRLREGPGTSYDTLSYLYPGMFITISETSTESGSLWGWGVTDSGASGWCAIKIPDYMTPVGWVDEKTSLALEAVEGGLRVVGYTGTGNELEIPPVIDGMPIVSIGKNAFTGASAPARVTVPESISSIEKGAFSQDMTVCGLIASSAHFAAVQDGCAFDMRCPESGIRSIEGVTAIEDGAFMGDSSLLYADLTSCPVTSIGSGAFRDCENLIAVILPDSVTSIADDAFDSHTVLVCAPGSYAYTWAQAHGIRAIAASGR